LVNRSPTRFTQGSRGIKQGDPISLLLWSMSTLVGWMDNNGETEETGSGSLWRSEETQ
ncbi:hypothetical protein KI387_029590, partial [Taxus chinensis]